MMKIVINDFNIKKTIPIILSQRGFHQEGFSGHETPMHVQASIFKINYLTFVKAAGFSSKGFLAGHETPMHVQASIFKNRLSNVCKTAGVPESFY